LAEPGTPEPKSAGGSSEPGKAVQPAQARGKGRDWELAHHLQFGLLALTIALYIITFVVQAFRIPSGSMEATLLVGDYLLVDKTGLAPSGHWSWLFPYRHPQRGQIIVFRPPFKGEEYLVKRVIGLPGDHITLWHKRVYINGEPLTEPYAVYREQNFDEFRDDFPRGNWINENVQVDWAHQMAGLVHSGSITVPRDAYFVLGDNRDQSLDSRYWGFVPRANIVGRPFLLYFSLNQPDESEDGDDPPIAQRPPDDKLLPLRTRIEHWLSTVRWQRILRLAP
jgi:signal peptidase I